MCLRTQAETRALLICSFTGHRVGAKERMKCTDFHDPFYQTQNLSWPWLPPAQTRGQQYSWNTDTSQGKHECPFIHSVLYNSALITEEAKLGYQL